MKIFKQEGQTPHRASRYFLCSARYIRKNLVALSKWFSSVELKIIKKARIRATAADLVTGQILVETMVALAMVVIGLLGFLSLLSYSIGLNKVVADQYVASYLASEGIEIIKNIEDNNVAQGLQSGEAYNANLSAGDYEVSYDTQPGTTLANYSGRNLTLDNSTHFYGYNAGPNATRTPFVRKISISYPHSEDEMVVQSIVNWTTRGGIQSIVTLEDHFYNWRQ